MTTLNVKDIEEARIWGRSLIVNGVLIIILVMFSNLDWAEELTILSFGIVMMWGGFCLCRFSDEAVSQISRTRKANEL
jgi:hypothetical protein